MKTTQTTETDAQTEQHGVYVILKALERDGLLDGFLASLPALELTIIRQELVSLFERTGMTWGPAWSPLEHGIPALLWGLK